MTPFSLLALCIPVVDAIKTVSAPATVTAGVEFPVSIAFDFDEGEYSIDRQWQSYRLYLSNSEAYYGINWPMCYLSDVLPLNTSSTNIIVPKDAGPRDNTYHIYVFTFNGSFFEDGGQEAGLDFSSAFELVDTDVGSYSPDEWSGPKAEYDSIPCSAMQCNRKCKERFYASRTAAFWTNTGYCECLAACPGVTTSHPSEAEGCSFEWGYMKTAGSERLGSTDVETMSAMTSQSESQTASSRTGTSLPQATAATTTPMPAAAATSTIVTDPTSGGALRLLATRRVYATLALLALLQ